MEQIERLIRLHAQSSFTILKEYEDKLGDKFQMVFDILFEQLIIMSITYINDNPELSINIDQLKEMVRKIIVESEW
jgi:hypothetical protein